MGEPLSYLVRRLPQSNYQKDFSMRLSQARFDLKDAITKASEVDLSEEDFDDIPF